MSNKKKSNIISFPSAPSKLERQVEAILFARPCEAENVVHPAGDFGHSHCQFDPGHFSGHPQLLPAIGVVVQPRLHLDRARVRIHFLVVVPVDREVEQGRRWSACKSLNR